MSYGLTAYTLDRAMLARACGSGRELEREILADDASRIESLGRALDVDVGAALRELLSGTARGEGPVYAYALELVCRRIGLPLRNAALYPVPLARLDTLDTVLAGAGFPIRFALARLALAGSPVPLPPRPDFPSVGWIDASATKAFAKQWREAPVDHDDPWTTAALAEVAEWARTASAEGEGLIAFYY